MDAAAGRGGRSLTSRQQLAAELGRLRDQAGISGRELAEQVGISQSKVSRIESGSTIPSLPEVEAWAEVVGAPADVRRQLADLTEAAFTEVRTWRAVLGKQGHIQDEIQEREARAQTVRTFQPSVVPGLLQTAEYARRVFSLFQVPYDEDSLAAALAGRLQRQQALFMQDRQFDFLITDAALRWCPDLPRGLVFAQLDRIASLSTLENVSIGLIPHSGRATTTIPHGFIIYSGRDGDEDTFVTVETVHADLVISNPDDVGLYENRWSLLRQMAVFDDEARTFIATLYPTDR